MPVGAYVRGKASQNDTQRARGEGQSPSKTSRQRNADTARVTVPITRLNGTPPAATSRKEPQQVIPGPSTGQYQGQGQRQHDPSIQAAMRDVFDTDVEAIDDSTTITSVAGGDGGDVQHQMQHPNEYSRRDSGSMDVDYGPTATSEHQTLAERLMMELGSDPEDDYHERAHDDDGAEAGDEEEIGDDETQLFDWDGPKNENGEPLSWQRIEAALRDGSTQQKENVPLNVHAPMPRPSPLREQEEFETRSSDGNGILEQRNLNTFQTPKAVPKFPSGGRFAPRSRFGTPNPPAARGTPSHAAAFAGSRPMSRPASAPGVPPSPKSMSRAIHREEDRVTLRNAPHTLDDEDKYNAGGVFDTTDLSVLDDSDSIDNQHTYTSLRLSTVSPVSTKRPHATFTSDYPPNILQSKSFSDLRAESFDYNPAPSQPIFPPQDPPLPLPEKLNRLKTLTDDQRQAFFSSLTIDQWEDSGDWLLEQFSILLKKAKDARHERRQVAALFEKEIERRYEAVEKEGGDIGKRLDEMRTGGMGVLKRHNSNNRQ